MGILDNITNIFKTTSKKSKKQYASGNMAMFSSVNHQSGQKYNYEDLVREDNFCGFKYCFGTILSFMCGKGLRYSERI